MMHQLTVGLVLLATHLPHVYGFVPPDEKHRQLNTPMGEHDFLEASRCSMAKAGKSPGSDSWEEGKVSPALVATSTSIQAVDTSVSSDQQEQQVKDASKATGGLLLLIFVKPSNQSDSNVSASNNQHIRSSQMLSAYQGAAAVWQKVWETNNLDALGKENHETAPIKLYPGPISIVNPSLLTLEIDCIETSELAKRLKIDEAPSLRWYREVRTLATSENLSSRRKQIQTSEFAAKKTEPNAIEECDIFKWMYETILPTMGFEHMNASPLKYSRDLPLNLPKLVTYREDSVTHSN